MALINHLFCSAPPALRSLRSFRRPPGARRGEGPAAPGRRGAGSRDGATSTRDSPGEGSASHLRPTGEFCGNSYKSPLLMVNPYKMVPQFVSVQLVYKSNFTMVYGRYKYSIHGVYKRTYNWGASSCEAQGLGDSVEEIWVQ